MTLDSTQDLFFLILAVATGWVAVFVCWALYEVARMLHQANAVVTETREKLNRVEKAISSIKERLEKSVDYFGMLAEGGKSLMSMFHQREERREKGRTKKSKLFDEE
ncbi:hypothetical protein HZC53_02455 [Candidatus Uhrbacteria bacterium]|nr:hypothetical protein [Candidatus Uhrbacteria bacterium]